MSDINVLMEKCYFIDNGASSQPYIVTAIPYECILAFECIDFNDRTYVSIRTNPSTGYPMYDGYILHRIIFTYPSKNTSGGGGGGEVVSRGVNSNSDDITSLEIQYFTKEEFLNGATNPRSVSFSRNQLENGNYISMGMVVQEVMSTTQYLYQGNKDNNSCIFIPLEMVDASKPLTDDYSGTFLNYFNGLSVTTIDPSKFPANFTPYDDEFEYAYTAMQRNGVVNKIQSLDIAEGIANVNEGTDSFANHFEGVLNTIAQGNKGYGNHFEGYENNISSPDSNNNRDKAFNHFEGYHNCIDGDIEGFYNHLEGHNCQIQYENNYSIYSAHVEGENCQAYDSFAHAEGYYTTAYGEASHAEGHYTSAHSYAHAEGRNCCATGSYSHAEGYGARATYAAAHAEGYNTLASDNYAHAEGYSTCATMSSAHAEGEGSKATGYGAHAEGYYTTAAGSYSHSEGACTTAGSNYSHAEGYYTTAYNEASHAEGWYTCANSTCAHSEGYRTLASNSYSHAQGYYTTASNMVSCSMGHYNAAMNTGGTTTNKTGTALAIGNGSSNSRSNCFSVQFDGVTKAANTITASTTADYAELFEWQDGNPNAEDRVGHFVTIDGDKIKIAGTDDNYILGVISGAPFVLGNGDCDTWNGMYLRDDFNRYITEPAPKIYNNPDNFNEEEYVYDEMDNQIFEGTSFKLNPDYDPNKPYVSRMVRQEWAAVGMLGVLAIIDDGNCQVNKYCTVGAGGIAIPAAKGENTWRVIKRINDNVVQIIFK